MSKIDPTEDHAPDLDPKLVGSPSQQTNEDSLFPMIDLPRVMLRDANDERSQDPVARPTSPEIPTGNVAGQFRIGGKIARGGMGAVLKGRDTHLGRDLAIKVLLDSHKDRPEVVQRFVEEAQIGGQLQHPGIAPVYALG